MPIEANATISITKTTLVSFSSIRSKSKRSTVLATTSHKATHITLPTYSRSISSGFLLLKIAGRSPTCKNNARKSLKTFTQIGRWNSSSRSSKVQTTSTPTCLLWNIKGSTFNPTRVLRAKTKPKTTIQAAVSSPTNTFCFTTATRAKWSSSGMPSIMNKTHSFPTSEA